MLRFDLGPRFFQLASLVIQAALLALAVSQVNGELTSLIGQLQLSGFDAVFQFRQPLPLGIEFCPFGFKPGLIEVQLIGLALQFASKLRGFGTFLPAESAGPAPVPSVRIPDHLPLWKFARTNRRGLPAAVAARLALPEFVLPQD